MAYMRLFRRIRIAPGLTLNVAKHGPSLSAGFRGAHITMGRTGIRRTVGIPGTGVFYTSHNGYHTGIHSAPHFAARPDRQADETTPGKSKKALPAFLLCTFLGLWGAHRLYAGRIGSGIAMLLISLTLYGMLVTAIWALIDWILILAGHFKDAQGNRIAW